MSGVARLGDACTHGATIVTASGDTLTNGIGTARLNDLVDCPKHGLQPIVVGAAFLLTNGRQTARIGDMAACGAIITTGSRDRIAGDGGSSMEEFEPVEGFQPWVSPSTAATHSTEDQVGPLTTAQKELYSKAGIPTNQTNPNPPSGDPTPAGPPSSTLVPPDCSDIHQQTSFDPTFRLSTNYLLAHLSTATILEKSEVRAQSGLTVQEIVCNLRQLCVNVLEPITATLGRPAINCGFRSASAKYGSSTSDHKLGQAVDLQWAGMSDSEYHETAMWIRDNLQWSQIILEWGGNRPWIHVAFHPSKVNRTNLLSRITVPNGYQKGLILCKNMPRVGGIIV